MDKENRENRTNNTNSYSAKKKFTLDESAQRKIDAEFSEPGYSSNSWREYYHRNSGTSGTAGTAGRQQGRTGTGRTTSNVSNTSNASNGRTSYGSSSRSTRTPVNSRSRSSVNNVNNERKKQNSAAMKKGKAQGKKILKDQKKNSYNDEFYDDEIIEETVPKKRKFFKIALIITIICIIVLVINIVIWLFTGKIWFNEPKKRDYPVRGPVITEDMGEIRWNKFPDQNIQLAFIRATKSTTYVDKRFDFNWDQSSTTDLPTGALHIFDPDTDGKEQAKHFSETVGDINGRIVPAVDIKFTGMHKIFSGNTDKITQRLVDFVEEIEDKYGVYPIISCDEKTYKKIVCNETNFSRKHKSNFEGCPIWYESLTSKPEDDVKWTFWCYTDRARYSYYDSKNFVDVVLYRGSEEQFKKYIVGENNEEYFAEDEDGGENQ